MIEVKNCLACGKILKGRSDKKYCDDYCRNNFNNSQKSSETNYVRNIINALRKNRLILQQLLSEGDMVKTTKEKLLLAGFQFNFHTHIFDNKKGGIYYYCFDYAYLPLDHDWYLIVKKKEGK